MKKRVLDKVPFALLVVILYIMYATKIGIPGIAECWSEFELLDMKFGYSVDMVTDMMIHLGEDGIRHYLYYLGVDFIFIAVLLWIQTGITKDIGRKVPRLQKPMMCLAVGRCVLDLLEDVLLALIMKRLISVNVVPVASAVTIGKFVCLFLWLIFLITGLIGANTKTELHYVHGKKER